MAINKILKFIGLAVFLFIFVIGCKPQEKMDLEPEEEIVETGILDIQSIPSGAQVYIEADYKGDTPITLYNFPVGRYEITLRKEGYIESKKSASVKAGRTEIIEISLSPAVKESKPAVKEVKEQSQEPTKEPPGVSGPAKINISKSFAMYYDFDNMEFTELRADGSDLFSRRYDNYVHFTALTPAKMNVINKPISEIDKNDCIVSDTAVASLFTDQSLCVQTGSGKVVAIGAVWSEMPEELQLIQFE